MIRLGNVSAHEYKALAALMGRPRHAQSIQIDVGAIDAAMSRAGIAPSLRATLERLDGPIPHLPKVRAEALARWAAVVERAQHPGFAQLLQTPGGLGLLKRLARQKPEAAERLRDSADLVLQGLPLSGQPRAQIAAEVLGDAHGLDNGQPVATLILAVLRQAGPPGEEAAAPDHAEEDSRTLWARVGVLAVRGRTVCTDGMPAAAQRTLLRQLANTGARLLYHGDFDWPGLRIANLVMRSFGAQPWRFGVADYSAAAGVASGQALAGTPVPASWDAALAPTMQQRGLGIAEEGVAAELLVDLGDD
jgi:hypothetical protein